MTSQHQRYVYRELIGWFQCACVPLQAIVSSVNSVIDSPPYDTVSEEARKFVQILLQKQRIQVGSLAESELTREEREWVLSRYRLLAYNQGQEGALSEEGNPILRGFTEEEIAAVITNKGKLSRWELLRCRVRYFSDGLVFGGKSFVNEVFVTERSRFGATRKSGAKPLRGLDIGELKTMRDLRRNPIGPR